MPFFRANPLLPILACAGCCALAPGARGAEVRRFDFSDHPAPESVAVSPATVYRPELGHGFEPGFGPGDAAFYFSVAVPEGNHRVTATLRGAPGGSTVTLKAELRRVLAGPLTLAEGVERTVTFVVNVRRPQIVAAYGLAPGEVRLKAPRETTQEAWAWDGRLTLEFNGIRPRLAALTIEPAGVPTIFLLGDSTVCDQSREPYTSWGQMLPRLFGPGVAIANHGESGETYRDSLARRRIDKIASVLRPGDWVLLQFGHNDQKQIAAGTGGPFTTYREEIARHVALVRAAGGVPVILSPMERRRFDAAGRSVATLDDYAQAARAAAAAAGAAFIDLHALSREFYEALGPEGSAVAFAAPDGRVDNTHHSAYGADQLARLVATAARAQRLGFARFLVPEFRDLDPARPDDPEKVSVPPSPLVTPLRPLGD